MLSWNSEADRETCLFELDDQKKPTIFALSSFSKLLGPGIRVGWIETNQFHINRFLNCGTLQSGGGANPLDSGIVHELMRSGFIDKHISMIRGKYRECCEAMCDGLKRYLVPELRPGENIRFYTLHGGFICFVTLPRRINSEVLLESCRKNYGVSYFSGKTSCTAQMLLTAPLDFASHI